MKKIISFALCFLMIFNVFPLKTFAEEQSLEEIIRPQVEAFARSIDQKNASGKAQDTLLSHGIAGGGKKLSVGKSHALTATLVNSELGKTAITEICTELIKTAKERNLNEIYSLGKNAWKIETDNTFSSFIYDYDAKSYKDGSMDRFPGDYIGRIPQKSYKKYNEYDTSLNLIAGVIDTDVDLKVWKIYNDKIVYEISVVLWDDFDFDAENGSDLENLLGFIGLLLFNPFVWESKFNFQIEIPIEKPEENITFGDSDGNGAVDVADAYFARLVAAKIVKPTKEQITFCDVDLDGKITAMDANIIRKFALGIIKELPIR